MHVQSTPVLIPTRPPSPPTKTEPWFMESVWWVFSQLHEKGLVYRGYKVMPFSTACGTPLSNFEAGLNYKDVQDPAVVVAFPLVEVCSRADTKHAARVKPLP